MFGDPSITREILGNLPGWLVGVFYAAAAAACGRAAFSLWRRQKKRHAGRASAGDNARRFNLRSIADYLAFHREMRRDPYAGWAHLLVFYGFVILFIGTCLVFLEHDTPLHFYYGWFYQAASLVIDLGGVAFLVGLAMLLVRRTAPTPGSARILRQPWVVALPILLLAIGVTGFLVEAARIAVDMPAFERYSAVGYAAAGLLRSLGVRGERALELHRFSWTLHAVLCVALFALLPWRFFGHMVYAPASWALRRRSAVADLGPQTAAGDAAPGVVQWSDFTALDLLQSDACTTCGRCNEACPAAAAGKPLRPRDVVLAIRDAMDSSGTADSNGKTHSLVADDVLWSCTTCGACNHNCPVGIDVYDKIIDLRRGRVESGAVPVAPEDVFEAVADDFNPYGRAVSERMSWAVGLDPPVAQAGESVELLYWIGCSGAFSPEGQSIARAMVQILNRLGVDYRVLGTAERCTGDPARRMGEEGLFRQCAARNGRMFRDLGVKRILTHCPHCYNTFKNEYGAGPEVIHHSEFLAGELAAGRLRSPGGGDQKITIHDPCYLGRGNGRTEPPRSVATALDLPIVEMPRHGVDSFCCGAGGGSMWLDVRGEARIENLRYAEAQSTGAAVVATACPFCKTMLEGARQSGEDGQGPRVLDLAELVAAAEGLSP
jgi:Fe-S oxidoreductase/nitrate reductase gamma subunit